jgi:thiamine-phosphate pyrophosphorylase
MRIGRLVVITDTLTQWRFTHEELAELACAGGADVIQLRDKRLADDQFLEIAERVRDICHRYERMLIINDRVEVARAVGAHGVHLGYDDMRVQDARVVLGSRAIIGASVGNVVQAQEAHRAGADYVGAGHVFATQSKAKPGGPIGLAVLADVCRNVSRPVIAIGGITEASVSDVMNAGAWGVAVIAAVCATRDPRAATAGFRAALDSLLRVRLTRF